MSTKRGSFSAGSFDDEVLFKSPNGTEMRIIPDRCLVTGFRVGTWDVLYRPVQTGNLMRAGLPTMVPNFSSLRGDKTFLETGTKLPHHGFGRISKWSIGETFSDGMSFYIDENEETLKQYPFKFRFTVDMRVKDNKLVHTLIMQNKETSKTLPVQPGLHPYLTCPHDKRPLIKANNIEGFDATAWKWTTKELTPDNNYPFNKCASFSIPGLGSVQYQEVPQDGKYSYRRMQIWSEPEGADDYHFVCLEPVVWHADGLNDPNTRLNIPPNSTVKIVMEIEAKPE